VQNPASIFDTSRLSRSLVSNEVTYRKSFTALGATLGALLKRKHFHRLKTGKKLDKWSIYQPHIARLS